MRQRRSFSIRHPGIGMGVCRRAGVLGGEVPDGMRAGVPGRQEVDACMLGNASLRTPKVEPGSQAWEACMMPLHYVRLHDALDTACFEPSSSQIAGITLLTPL